MGIVVPPPADFKSERPKPIPGETLTERLDRLRAWRKANRPKQGKKRRKNSRRCATTEPIDWLRDKIFLHVYGERVGEDVLPNFSKEAFIGLYNQERHGRSLPNYKFQDHFEGRDTYYYFSSPNKTAEYALAMIDIDVLKSRMLGSPEGARQFATFLRTLFPNLYVEASTGGKGQHAYLLVHKLGYSAEEVKKWLKHLERWLRQQAKGFDIELVEVKGAPPVIHYGDGGWIECLKYGSFAKLPRDVSRFSEWTRTTVMTVNDLRALPLDEETHNEEAGEDNGPANDVRPAAGDLCIGKNIDPDDLDLLALGVDTHGEDAGRNTDPKQGDPQAGSVSGKNIGQDDLDLIPVWERFFKKARKNSPLHGDRWLVTATDFAQTVVLLRFLTLHPNPDGSLPQRRVGELWTALYDKGDFSRPWNHHRFKAIRDWLSDMGWLDWKDNRFKEGTGRGDGRACKWRLHEEFVQLLDEFALHHEEGGASFVDTGIRQKGPGEPLKPVRCWFQQAETAEFWLEAEKACENLCAA